ncbi:hypothetical protein [Jannaschia rubra]|uniref:Uncharacterized protein n=1 Tax=Jannaschia rubra TaxID=282197 RepID=A0A0M6XV29_9RHOB|nr:hypothetical protein [Jannaschia rubra]CTQ34133.1 hypothetical protein JAN5088_02925 [Jannaschia rubra]SFG22452.1 hypothetical protein SAMN04488517_103212 [Jannaschia rubra]
MRRLHFYVMGLISLAYGVLALVEYVLISYRLRLAWLDMYSLEQLDWLASLPTWVQAVWGAHVVLALVGALCLLAHVRASVWMLAFAFITLVVILGWGIFAAQPTLIAIAGGGGTVWLAMALVLLLSFLLYLYARQEKRTGEVL